MSKRSAADGQTEGQAYPKVFGSAPRRNDVVDEIGEFEDAWEDEIEDEEPVDGEVGQGEDGTRTCRLHLSWIITYPVLQIWMLMRLCLPSRSPKNNRQNHKPISLAHMSWGKMKYLNLMTRCISCAIQ